MDQHKIDKVGVGLGVGIIFCAFGLYSSGRHWPLSFIITFISIGFFAFGCFIIWTELSKARKKK